MIAHSTFLTSESYRLFNVKQALVNLIKYNIYFLQLGDMNELYAFSIILNLINWEKRKQRFESFEGQNKTDIKPRIINKYYMIIIA